MPRGGAPTGKWPAAKSSQLGAAPEPGDPRQFAAKLIVRRPDVPEVEILLEKPELVIGRQTNDVDLTLDDDLVSRRHARLTMDARGYFRLDDLGSRNGITYAGRPVRRLNLIDGDVFQIGKTEFVFHARMQRLERPVEAPPRQDSALSDVPIPEPEADVDPTPEGEGSRG